MLFRHHPIVWVNGPGCQYHLGALGSLEEPGALRRRLFLLLDLPHWTKERTHDGELLEERS